MLAINLCKMKAWFRNEGTAFRNCPVQPCKRDSGSPTPTPDCPCQGWSPFPAPGPNRSCLAPYTPQSDQGSFPVPAQAPRGRVSDVSSTQPFIPSAGTQNSPSWCLPGGIPAKESLGFCPLTAQGCQSLILPPEPLAVPQLPVPFGVYRAPLLGLQPFPGLSLSCPRDLHRMNSSTHHLPLHLLNSALKLALEYEKSIKIWEEPACSSSVQNTNQPLAFGFHWSASEFQICQ